MVSYGFPQKFPPHPKGFLNPRCDSLPRKQETFDSSPALTLRIQGFLGGKPFPTQETQSFLTGFLRGECSWH